MIFMMRKLLFCVLWTATLAFQPEKPCKLKEFDDGCVCVCNEEYCDTIDVPQLGIIEENEYVLVTSTKSGDRFSISTGDLTPQTESRASNTQQVNNNVQINIDRTVEHKEILGFGTSFTGAVTYLLSKLPQSLRAAIFKGYYSSDIGMGQTLMRMPIGGCDFDLEPWTYNEYPENDVKLTNFTKLDPRDKQRTDFIKELKSTAKNSDIKLIGAGECLAMLNIMIPIIYNFFS